MLSTFKEIVKIRAYLNQFLVNFQVIWAFSRFNVCALIFCEFYILYISLGVVVGPQNTCPHPTAILRPSALPVAFAQRESQKWEKRHLAES